MSAEFVKGIRNAGFSAVYIDTHGFADNGQAINQFYSEVLDLEPIISSDGWLYLYVIDESALDIRTLEPGYVFLKSYTAEMGLSLGLEELCDLTSGLIKRDSETCEVLWDWSCEADFISERMSDEDFVVYLYEKILGRTVDDHGYRHHMDLLENGYDRKKMFVAFLGCDEFRGKYNLDAN
jgi:hypothetical protein